MLFAVTPNGPNAKPWYDGKTSFEAATPVLVNAGTTTANIHVKLEVGASISGRVTVPALTPEFECAPQIVAYDESGKQAAWACPDGALDYTLDGLLPGTYRIAFGGTYWNVGTQWFPAKGSFESATPITLSEDTHVTDVDATLSSGGIIGGSIDFVGGVVPIVSDCVVEVTAFNQQGEWVAKTCEDARLNYQLPALEPGTYTVRYHPDPQLGMADQWYDEVSTRAQATPVSIVANGLRDNVDALLDRPVGPGPITPGEVSISGGTTVGDTLTAKTGTWSPAEVTFTYQWLRNGSAVSGATSSTYKTVAADADKQVSVRVTGSLDGISVDRTSPAVSVQAQPAGPNKPVVTRLAGESRYGTNLEVNKEAGIANGPVFIATGGGFADALSIGPVVRIKGAPCS